METNVTSASKCTKKKNFLIGGAVALGVIVLGVVCFLIFSSQDPAKASFEDCMAKAEEGNPEYQYELAYRYANGVGVTQDSVKAVKLYQQAAEQEFTQAQYDLGKCYLYGIGVEKNDTLANDLFKKAAAKLTEDADNDNPFIQSMIGECYFYGRGVTEDREKAFTYLSSAAESGLAQAQYVLSQYYKAKSAMDGSARNNYVAWASKAAEQGHIEAIMQLADDYKSGDNYAKAFELYSKAANMGIAKAQYQVARYYYGYYGDVVKEDKNQAIEWLTKASDQGYYEAMEDLSDFILSDEKIAKRMHEWLVKRAEKGDDVAQYTLGEEYYWGKFVEKDYAKAFEWALKSAKQGNDNAQFRVAYCYASGEGTNKNFQEAIEWYICSAENENSAAQYNLGVMYHNGEGVKKDIGTAIYWYKKAAVRGDKDAIEALGRLGVLY